MGPAAATFDAVAPGTDLSQRARELAVIHDAVIGRGRPPGRPAARPRGVVARSRTR